MEARILHSDLNGFYASAELFHRPDLRHKPVVVGGDEEARHGIVLAGNRLAKKLGIKTGIALVDARRLCPQLVTIPPNYPLYLKISGIVREIYSEYTDISEAFGLDESWLDISIIATNMKQATAIANDLRKRINKETGLTVSVGVSWNKPFAKLGSDMKKPDATTTITKENYKETVYPLPAADLLYVGPATARKFSSRGIETIGDIANTKPDYLRSILQSKNGYMIWNMATGNDLTPVWAGEGDGVIKSIGNSCTFPRDLIGPEDVKKGFFILAESVAARLRHHGYLATTCAIHLRGKDLISCTRQMKFDHPTCLATELTDHAMRLYTKERINTKPLRSIGVRGTGLIPANSAIQLSLLDDMAAREKRVRLEQTLDFLRNRFGYFSVQRGTTLKDKDIVIDAKNDNTIHPVGYAYSN